MGSRDSEAGEEYDRVEVGVGGEVGGAVAGGKGDKALHIGRGEHSLSGEDEFKVSGGEGVSTF